MARRSSNHPSSHHTSVRSRDLHSEQPLPLALATPGGLSSVSAGMSTFQPRRGEIFLAVVSMRGALNKIAVTLASAQNIDLSLPELPPLPDWVGPRPLIYVGPTRGGHTAIPLATFGHQAPDTLDLLLQKVVIPIGEVASALPLFEGKISFETYPRWRHRDGRPAYIVPEQIFIPETVAMHRETARRSMSARTLNRLVKYCRDVIRDLTLLSKEEAESILDSYTEATLNRPLYPVLTEAYDPEAPSMAGQDVASLAEQDAVPAADLVAAQQSASPTMALNPLARPFTPRFHSSGGAIDVLDIMSRLSLVTGASSAAPTSILSVLQDSARQPADYALPPAQRKVQRAHADGVAAKENRAP